MYGHSLSQQNIEQVKAFTEAMLKAGIATGEYFWLFPADNIILPSVDHLAEIYNREHGFYLHSFSWQVIDQNLQALLQWGPPLGQMARRPGDAGEESYDVKHFIEKPDIATLTLSVISNAIEEAGYTEEEFIEELAKAMGTTAEDLNQRYYNNVLALLVMPMVTNRGAWEGMYAFDSARDAIDRTLQSQGKSRLSEQEWASCQDSLRTAKEYIQVDLIARRTALRSLDNLRSTIAEYRRYGLDEFIDYMATRIGIRPRQLIELYDGEPLRFLLESVSDVARDRINEVLAENGEDILSYDALESLRRDIIGIHIIEERMITSDTWSLLYARAQQLPKTVKKLVNSILDKGGRNSYANTFYFLMSRDVAETFYRLYSHLWLEVPDKKVRATEPFGFSALVLTPMVTPLTDADREEGRDVPRAWSYQLLGSKYEQFYNQAGWDEMWRKAQELKAVANGLKGADVPLWIDVGTPQESAEAINLGTSTADPVRRALYLGLFGHDVVASEQT